MEGGLAAHEAQVARDLELLTLPPANWTAPILGPDGQPVLDVLVVGAGMYGIAAAGALTFKGLRNLLVIDRAPEGQEGPWITTARMETLRSPKHLPGVALGIPSLTLRAWYEAREGSDAWERLYKVPNAVWQDYLLWVRRVLRLPVCNGVELISAVPQQGLVAVILREEGGVERIAYARRLVLASGRSGTGGVAIPAGIDPALGPDRLAHSNDDIGFERLRGRHIAVIGAGPSSWDNAATALERGAARVDIYVRRTVLPQINKGRGSAHPGFFEGWAELPPEQKWRLLVYMHDLQAPPPHESIHRALRYPGFHIHFGTPLHRARPTEGGVALELGNGSRATVDFLILGTGFNVDVARIPELAPVASDIATWADRYTPPPELVREELSRFPWLGPGFELQERAPRPGLSRIHLFNHAALASLGAIASDVPGVSVGAERLAHAMAVHFFAEDIDDVRARLEAFAEPELLGTPFFALPG
jgi:cation diffusion facilitator CzcD-associated flavoprotein CzcO